MKLKLLLVLILLFASFVFRAQAAEEETQQTDTEKASETRIVVYPILFQAPLYGAKVNLPEIPDIGEPAFSRTTDYSLDSAFLAGITVEKDNWFFEFEGEYAGLSAKRETPFLTVDADVVYFNVMGGWKFYKDIAVTGGIKRLAVDIHANLGDLREAQTKPGLWDPMIGIDWRRFVTPKLHLNAFLEGGGFGVGSDVDISGAVDADWEVFPHFVLNAGYGFLYFKTTVEHVTVRSIDREFKINQTLHGPRIGLGISF